MRTPLLLPAALSLLALSLSGCFWWAAGMDDGPAHHATDGDLSFPLALLGLLLILGCVLLAANHTKSATDRQSPPPPPTPARAHTETPPAPEWTEGQAPPRKAPSRSAKARREKP